MVCQILGCPKFYKNGPPFLTKCKKKTRLRGSIIIGKMVVPLDGTRWYPSCLTPPRSPWKGDIPNKYPLYKVYMGLITKGRPSQGVPLFSLWYKLSAKIQVMEPNLMGFFSSTCCSSHGIYYMYVKWNRKYMEICQSCSSTVVFYISHHIFPVQWFVGLFCKGMIYIYTWNPFVPCFASKRRSKLQSEKGKFGFQVSI